MHVCPPLAGVELEESDAPHAVPASGEGQPGFVFLRVFVCVSQISQRQSWEALWSC